MTGDFWDKWDKLHDMFDKCLLWQNEVKSGNYPDCDMLPLGKLCKKKVLHIYTSFRSQPK